MSLKLKLFDIATIAFGLFVCVRSALVGKPWTSVAVGLLMVLQIFLMARRRWAAERIGRSE